MPGGLLHKVRSVSYGRPDFKGRALKMEPSRFDLREIQYVVNDGDEALAGITNRLNKVFLLSRKWSIEQETRHAKNTVHRSSYLVAHHGKKLTLRLIGAIRLDLEQLLLGEPAINLLGALCYDSLELAPPSGQHVFSPAPDSQHKHEDEGRPGGQRTLIAPPGRRDCEANRINGRDETGIAIYRHCLEAIRMGTQSRIADFVIRRVDEFLFQADQAIAEMNCPLILQTEAKSTVRGLLLQGRSPLAWRTFSLP